MEGAKFSQQVSAVDARSPLQLAKVESLLAPEELPEHIASGPRKESLWKTFRRHYVCNCRHFVCDVNRTASVIELCKPESEEKNKIRMHVARCTFCAQCMGRGVRCCIECQASFSVGSLKGTPLV